jgi:CPA2 family monovalent cation:H+ antiporter-2
LGVEHVYRETLDTSLRMGVDALRLVGLRTYHAHRAARKFRMHDEASVRDLAAMRHDRESYINLARERIRDLEELLLSDLRDRDADADAGWDTDSLRQEFGQPADD